VERVKTYDNSSRCEGHGLEYFGYWGAGYIGKPRLQGVGDERFVPITYDDLSRGNRWAVKWGPFEKGEIGGTGRVQAVFEKYRHMALMHFVAYAYVGENVSDIVGGGCLSRPSAACSKPRAVRTGEADCRCMGLGKKPNGCLASMNPRC
jgi:hypothetical protein